MDEVNITTKFTKGLIGNILRRIIKKKFGYDTVVQLNEFNTTIGDTVHVHLSIDAEMSKEDFKSMMFNEVLKKG